MFALALIRSKITQYFCVLPVLMLSLTAGPLLAARLSTVPLAPLPSQWIWTDAYKTRQPLIYEAQGKIRSYQLAAMLDPVKTAAMEMYDVSFYDLNLDLNPNTRILTGTVSISAQVTGGTLATAEFHLKDTMLVSDVRSGGGSVAFTHTNNLLDVTLERAYASGEMFTVTVDYSGNPAGDYFGWDTYGSDPLVWSLSEPYGAREWWPCKDLNTDKADSVDIKVTVPDPLVVASNGTLVSTSVPETGKTTYYWQERYPICTYLVSLAAHPFEQFTDMYTGLQNESMPVTNFVVPDKLGTAMAGYAITPSIIHTFALAYGEYPFLNEKYGHAHFPWGGGMEHQTCSSMSYDYYYETFIAHELSHQWFGDMITCADFHHIWLNEGFATWSEAYWLEQSRDEAAYHDKMNGSKYLGGGTVYVTDVTDFNVIFNYYTTYAKASWVVHMLRHVMGDTDFFAALTSYRTAYAFSSATTEDFQAVCEGVSGLDLAAFFSEWIYGNNHPQYEVSWTLRPEGAGYGVDLRIAQIQTNAGVFSMPLDIRVTTMTGVEDFVVQNDQAVQWYHFSVADYPDQVTLDPDGWVLCEISDAGISGVGEGLPTAPQLLGAAPNPFNPMTSIRFSLPAAQTVQLVIYDVSGRRIRDLAPGLLEAGDHSVTWNGQDQAGREVSSGTYFARMTVNDKTQVSPLTLVR